MNKINQEISTLKVKLIEAIIKQSNSRNKIQAKKHYLESCSIQNDLHHMIMEKFSINGLVDEPKEESEESILGPKYQVGAVWIKKDSQEILKINKVEKISGYWCFTLKDDTNQYCWDKFCLDSWAFFGGYE